MHASLHLLLLGPKLILWTKNREKERERDTVNRACVCVSCRCAGVCACVCAASVTMRERQRARQKETDRQTETERQRICKCMNNVLPFVTVYVSACVWSRRETEQTKSAKFETKASLYSSPARA